MAPVTKSAIVRAIAKHTDEAETDPRGVAILFGHARGNKNWSKLALTAGVTVAKAQQLFFAELRRRAKERAQLADQEIELLLADWDAELVTINDLIADTETLDLVDVEGKLGPRILGYAKLLEQKHRIAKLKIDLLGLNAPNRVAVLVGQTAAMPSPEEMETWSPERLDAEWKRQKQLHAAVIDTTGEIVAEATNEQDTTGEIVAEATGTDVAAADSDAGPEDPEATPAT